MEKFKQIISIILLFVLSVPILRPLFAQGFFPMHDDTQPARVFEIAQALKDGQFPVRWVRDLGYGYGYPIFNFYSPLPYYFGSIWILAGLDVLLATKLMFTAGILLAFGSMFLLGKKMWGIWGGVLAAILYSYAPYHAVQIYVRGAAGEYWAYAFLPLVILGFLEIKSKNNTYGLLIGSIGLAGVILSHNIIAFLMLGGLGAWLLVELVSYVLTHKFSNFHQSVLMHLVWLVGFGLGLAAFFWLPAFSESGLTRAETLIHGTNDYRAHFVYIDQLWNSTWGYGGSAPGRADGLSFKIGKIHLLLAALTFFLWIWKKDQKNLPASSNYMWPLFWIGFSIVMMLPDSQWLWERIPLIAYVQYPWRFLVFSLLGISALAAGMASLWPRYNRLLVVVLGLLVIGINVKYFEPQYIRQQSNSDYTSEARLKWELSKISDEYLPKDFPIPKDKTQVAQSSFLTDGIIVTQSEVKTHFSKFTVSASHAAEFVFSQAYFPGWQAVIDTNRVPIELEQGLIKIMVPPGEHRLTFYFGDTWVRTLGNFVSLLSLIIWLKMLLKYIDYERRHA